MRGLFSEITKDRNKNKAKIYPPKNLSTAKTPNEKGAIHRKHLSYADAQLSILGKLKVNFCRLQTPNHHKPE